jgi:Icc-related predicted phosphoesterase
MTRVLAIADEVDEGLYGHKLLDLRPDLVLSCGDLPFEYLENLVSRLDVPLLYVPGNHDPSLAAPDPSLRPLIFEEVTRGPRGCVGVDGRIEEALGLRVAGLGGSIRYNAGPNQYSQAQMRRRALRLRLRAWLPKALGGRPVDVLLTHSPPAGDDPPGDAAHRGFAAFNNLYPTLRPRLHVHGHLLRHGPGTGDRRIARTLVVNAIPYRLLEL